MTPIIVRDVIELFLAPKTANTKRAYRQALDHFERHCGTLAEMTPERALRYFVGLKPKYSDATIRLRFQVINAIVGFLMDMDMLSKNPLRAAARAISWRQAIQVRPTALLPFGGVRKIIRHHAPNTKNGIRNRGMLALLFGSGLRRSEAIALDMGAIKVSPDGVIYLELTRTKGGIRQPRTIAKFAWKYLSVYVSQRKSEGATNDDPLFVFYYRDGKPGKRLNESTLYRVFRSTCKALGFKAAPHAARTTFGSKLWADTLSEITVADALGHKGTTQVKRYAKDREKIGMKKINEMDYD